MSSVLLDIEIGLGELIVSVLTLVVGYLVWQWWTAQKEAASGLTRSDAGKLGSKMNGVSKHSATNGTSDGKEGNLPMSIFFGSQSGTSETFAHELSEEAKLFGFKAVVHDLQDYNADCLCDESFAVFLMSTFGEGDPTDNAAEFYEWINNEQREEGELSKVTFAVFALGNRQYEHFCNIGRRVDHRLAELGGNRLVEHGEGDDDGSLEDDYSTWKAQFWARTKQHFGLSGEAMSAMATFKPNFVIDWKSEEAAARYIGGLSPSICDPKHKPILAKVVENRQLRLDVPEGADTNADGESTRHLELDVSALRLSYVTADNLGVCPRNDYKSVGRLMTRLKVKPNQVLSLKPLGKRKAPVPSPCSVHDALLWYCDFESVPRANLLTTLAQYTTDEGEKAQLHAWTHHEKESYVREERSLLEVLEELPGIDLPFVDFLELCPRIQPRFYTISSSSFVQPKQVAITVALSFKHKTRGRIYRGLASTFLCGLTPGKDSACVFIRPSSFRLPKPKRMFVNGSPVAAQSGAVTPAASPSPSPPPSIQAVLPPVLMVGPGTGVAPFRAFIAEFGYLRSKNLPSFPSTHLFFGCRSRDVDFIYKDEFNAAVEKETLSALHTAFSREQEQKVYVQSDLKAQAEKVWQLISQQRAYFYVCGGTLMGRQVKEVVQHIVEQHGNMTAQAAAEYVKKMQTDGRYIQELWS